MTSSAFCDGSRRMLVSPRTTTSLVMSLYEIVSPTTRVAPRPTAAGSPDRSSVRDLVSNTTWSPWYLVAEYPCLASKAAISESASAHFTSSRLVVSRAAESRDIMSGRACMTCAAASGANPAIVAITAARASMRLFTRAIPTALRRAHARLSEPPACACFCGAPSTSPRSARTGSRAVPRAPRARWGPIPG